MDLHHINIDQHHVEGKLTQWVLSRCNLFFCTVEIGALQLIKLKDPEADAFIRYSITGDDSNR